MTDEDRWLTEMVVEGEDEATGAAIISWRTTKKPDHWIDTDSRGESVVKYALGGREYALTTKANCKTCQSDHRFVIEDALLKSYSYQRILDSLPEGHNLTVQNLGMHAKKHLPVRESVRRAIQESDARDRGLDLVGFEGALANYLTLGKLVVQETLERLMDGELKPDLKDGAAYASLLLRAHESTKSDEAIDDIEVALAAFYEAAVSELSADEVQRIGERMEADPALASIRQRLAEKRALVR